jgi:hypothetical protein
MTYARWTTTVRYGISFCSFFHESFTILHAQTALQVYCRGYKRVQADQSYGLLRKARRLDEVLTETLSRVTTDTSLASSSSASGPTCASCHTQFSPSFHSKSSGAGSEMWLCHRCAFRPIVAINGDSSISVA